MKIGIFTNYSPGVSLNTEGLGRYLGSLIKGFVDSDDEVVIACPKWSTTSLRGLLKDLDIREDRIKILSNSKMPILWLIYKRVFKNRKSKQKINLQNIVDKVMIFLASQKSVILFTLLSAVISIFGVLGFVFRLIFKALRKIRSKLINIVKGSRIAILIRNAGKNIFSHMKSVSAMELVKQINKVERMDVWFVPSLFWPEVNSIKNQTVVINAPDLVTDVFAIRFSELIDPSETTNCRKTLLAGENFITYCDYVGIELIENKYYGTGKRWKTILHSNHDLNSVINIPQDVAKQMGVNKNLTYEFSKSLISLIHTNNKIVTGHELCNTKYIFYPSQCRPNKNMLNLVKAYEYLLRKRFRHERLVLTGDINIIPEIKEFIEKHDLKNDIVVCHGVSQQQLAALYCCAELVVNPTLYEGGFPFTFGEGMSVGTPSVMSDIPQTRFVFEPAGLEQVMFDPYDYRKMADKIEWGLDNISELYDMELPLYEELAKRTDLVVAKEYRAAFIEFSSKDREISKQYAVI